MPELQKAHVAHPKGPSDNVCPLYVRLCFPVCGLCTLKQQGRNSSASHSALINISMSTVCMCTSLHSGNEMKEIQKRSILIHTYSVWKKGEKCILSNSVLHWITNIKVRVCTTLRWRSIVLSMCEIKSTSFLLIGRCSVCPVFLLKVCSKGKLHTQWLKTYYYI